MENKSEFYQQQQRARSFLGKWHFLEKRMGEDLMDSSNQDKVLSAGLCNEAIILTFLWERKFQYFFRFTKCGLFVVHVSTLTLISGVSPLGVLGIFECTKYNFKGKICILCIRKLILKLLKNCFSGGVLVRFHILVLVSNRSLERPMGLCSTRGVELYI